MLIREGDINGPPPAVDLTGPAGWVYGCSLWEVDEMTFSTSGELAPGIYRIVSGFSGEFYGNNSVGDHAPSLVSIDFVVAMEAPACPCDWNNDSAVGSPDFFAFLDDFFAGEADFNFDGPTNSQDFFNFLGCFFASPSGCA